MVYTSPPGGYSSKPRDVQWKMYQAKIFRNRTRTFRISVKIFHTIIVQGIYTLSLHTITRTYARVRTRHTHSHARFLSLTHTYLQQPFVHFHMVQITIAHPQPSLSLSLSLLSASLQRHAWIMRDIRFARSCVHDHMARVRALLRTIDFLRFPRNPSKDELGATSRLSEDSWDRPAKYHLTLRDYLLPCEAFRGDRYLDLRDTHIVTLFDAGERRIHHIRDEYQWG